MKQNNSECLAARPFAGQAKTGPSGQKTIATQNTENRPPAQFEMGSNLGDIFSEFGNRGEGIFGNQIEDNQYSRKYEAGTKNINDVAIELDT